VFYSVFKVSNNCEKGLGWLVQNKIDSLETEPACWKKVNSLVTKPACSKQNWLAGNKIDLLACDKTGLLVMEPTPMKQNWVV
jgi:hypothetical protein